MSSNEYYWGNTSHEIKRIFYTWTIENYDLLRDLELDIGMLSPTFPSNDSDLKFCLEIVSSDSCDHSEPPHLHVCLDTLFDNSIHKGKMKIYLEGCSDEYYYPFNTPKMFCFKKFPDLICKTVIIHCEIVLVANTIEKCGEHHNLIKVPKCKLAEDLGNMLNTKELADVTIVTSDGHKIPAHKFVLSGED